jgi:hypothetical protein
MSSPALANAVNNLNTAQSIELQQFVTDLRTDPDNLSSYIQENRNSLVNDVLSQRSDTFNKVYGDATRASNTQNNIYYYYTRNKDLDNLQKELYDRSQYDVGAVTYDKDLAQRQYEINEWSYGNKTDTLFVFQMVLIALVLLAPLLWLSRQGTVPSNVLTGVAVLLGLVIVLTIGVRAYYTSYSRDKRYWNRRQFNKQGGPVVPSGGDCAALSSAYNSAIGDISAAETEINNDVNYGLTTVGDASTSVGNSVINKYINTFSS